MKNLHAILISAVMMFSGAFANAQTQGSIWERQDPAKGLYFGSSSAGDIFTRHQEAIAAALIGHAMRTNNSITGITESSSSASGSSTLSDVSTSVNSESCGIEIIEYKDHGDMAEVLVRIDSKGSDYTYELKVDSASMESDGKITFRSNISLKLSDRSGQMLLYFISQDTEEDHLSKISFSSAQTK